MNRVLCLSFLAALVLASCTGSIRPGTDAASDRSLVVSPNDERSYLTFELPNRLKVLVISDPATDRSAAALNVFTGSFDDPADREGLAHFLEHMLFLGTEKFPEADDYQEYISSHGGSNNAYTANDHTNYFFDITPEFLEPALERFSQFFIAPLFNEAYVDREKNAVNSEYQLRLKDDNWRNFAVSRQLVNPEHPASRFNIGSLETLADRPGRSVREDLLAFYERRYSANRMALVILGREDAGTLAEWSRTYFAEVPDRDLPASRHDMPVYTTLPRYLQIRPVKETYQISWNFPVPPFDEYYEKNPAMYIGNILGHEGEGSLHARLKELGWIEYLAAGGSRFSKEQGVISVSIGLTEAGRNHQAEIGELLFHYIDLVKDEGVREWLFREQSVVSNMSFDFQEKGSPSGYVRRLASNFLLYPDHHLLYGPYALTDYDADLIEGYLRLLRPDNVLVTEVSPTVETTQEDPWFNVEYQVSGLPEDWRDRWERALEGNPQGELAGLVAGLAMIEPNPFLPDSLDLVENTPQGRPQRVVEENGLQVWLLTDTEFGTPRANIRLRLESDVVYASAVQAAKAYLFSRLVMDALNAYAYPAQLAGLGYVLAPDDRGITLTISGYSDKQAVLLDRVLSTIKELEVAEGPFDRYQHELIRGWRNSRQDPPYVQAMSELQRTVLQPFWSNEELEAAIDGLTVADLESWQRDFLSSIRVEALIHGNVTTDTAAAVGELVKDSLLRKVPQREPVAHRRLVKLDGEGELGREVVVDHDDAAMVVYVQGDGQGYEIRARYGLLVQILRAPYFNDMRTERQLGYLVTVVPRAMIDTPGVLFIVQSPVASPDNLLALTREFADGYEKELLAMTEQGFRQHQAAMIAQLKEKDKNLGERSGRLWNDFNQGILSFDSRERMAEEVAKLTKDDVLEVHRKVMAKLATGYLLVYSPGKFFVGSSSRTRIADTSSFKEGRDFYTLRLERQ